MIYPNEHCDPTCIYFINSIVKENIDGPTVHIQEPSLLTSHGDPSCIQYTLRSVYIL